MACDLKYKWNKHEGLALHAHDGRKQVRRMSWLVNLLPPVLGWYCGNGGPHIYFPLWNKIIARNWNAALIWLKIAHAWHLVQKMMAWMVLNVGP